MSRRLRIVGLLSLALIGPLPAQGADATAVATAVFDGTATLASVPCVPAEPDDCRGSIEGHWAGQAVGRLGARPFELTWKTLPGAFTATFQYTEPACDGTGGVARGTATATAGPGTMTGTWVHGPGDTFPRPIVDLEATFRFEWVRTGGGATLNADDVVLSFTVAGLAQPIRIVGDALGITAHMPAGGCGERVASPVTGVATVTQS